MSISLRRTSVRWTIGWAPLVAAACYVVLAAVACWFGCASGVDIAACRFKLLTGLPCPTCGATRAALALLTGHLADAWRFNPVMTCAYLVGPLWLIIRYLTGRRVVIGLTPRARWVAVGLLILAVAANWAYLIASGI